MKNKFKVKPLPNRNKSLNPEAKQNLLLCNVKPVTLDNIHTDANVASDAENKTENRIDKKDRILPVYKFFLCFENCNSFVFVVIVYSSILQVVYLDCPDKLLAQVLFYIYRGVCSIAPFRPRSIVYSCVSVSK